MRISDNSLSLTLSAYLQIFTTLLTCKEAAALLSSSHKPQITILRSIVSYPLRRGGDVPLLLTSH